MGVKTLRDNKKTWAVNKRAELNKKLNKILTEELKDEESMRKLLAHYRIVGLYTYSLFNTMLIKAQGGTIAQSFTRWKKLNRHVKKGEKAYIYVYVPITVKEEITIEDEEGNETIEEVEKVKFLLKPVFDISQTEGEPLKYEHNTEVYNSNLEYNKLKEIIEKKIGLGVTETPIEARGRLLPAIIQISEFSNEIDKVRTLIHETAHYLLDHLEDERPREILEIEAEAVTFLVLEYFNFLVELSRAYVEHWKELTDNDRIKEVKKGKILKVADKIIQMVKDD